MLRALVQITEISPENDDTYDVIHKRLCQIPYEAGLTSECQNQAVSIQQENTVSKKWI
jgi:hypothetical protein